MGVWSTLLKYGGKAMKGVGTATATTGKSMGKAVLHPSQTLRGAGQAVKTATIGGAVGYVGWEKLTTDVSGLSIAGLVAAAFLIFGRFGWLGKIAGAFLGMMLIGNNAGVFRTPETENVQRTRTPELPAEEQTHGGGMRR